jgi:hypothetical protein
MKYTLEYHQRRTNWINKEKNEFMENLQKYVTSEEEKAFEKIKTLMEGVISL